jgi:hypothetical protein
MRQNARKFGLTLGVLILAVLIVGVVALALGPVSAQDGGGNRAIRDLNGSRMEDSGGGEAVAPRSSLPGEGDILFEQPPSSPDDPWWEGYTSDGDWEYLCFEDFWGLTEDIGDIHWYGFSLDDVYANCDPTGIEFEVIFYEDSGGSPGAQVATFSNVIPTITDYDEFAYYKACRFEVADLGMPVSLTDGWVSIQSTSSPNGCAFFWLTSPTGNANAIQSYAGEDHILYDNLAFALTGVPEPIVGVGGEAYPASKISLLAPWFGLGVLLAGGISWFVLRRRKAQG